MLELLVETDYTYDDCVQKIYKEYGENVSIIRTKRIKTGGILGFFQKDAIEVTFTVRKELNYANYSGNPNGKDKNHSLPTYIPHSDLEEKEKILKNIAERSPEIIEKTKLTDEEKKAKTEEVLDKESEQLEMLRTTVAELALRVSNLNINSGISEEHPNLKKLSGLLDANAFSNAYIQKVLDYVKKNLSINDLDDFSKVQTATLARIAETIKIKTYGTSAFSDEEHKAKVFTIVGPTGVGKTTTLAKLCAYYLLAVSELIKKELKVMAITIDNYRIGGWQQIQTYCEHMYIPLTVATNREELYKYIDEYRDSYDVVFIDTTGRSPNDSKKIQDMYRYFEGLNTEIEVFLAVNASTQAHDVSRIMEQYKMFDYSSLIITKLDETTYPGGVISTLDELNYPVSYVTVGQGVPSDLCKATVGTFLKRLYGFDEVENFVAKHYFSEDNYIKWR